MTTASASRAMAGRHPVTSGWSPCVSAPRWRGDGWESRRRPATAASASRGPPAARRVARMPPERARITVLLVEDHLLVAEGLAAMLRATGDLDVVGTAATTAAAGRPAAACSADVVGVGYQPS